MTHPQKTPDVDVEVENHGSIFIFRTLTDTARSWVSENVDLPEYMRLGPDAFTVEHRCAADLASGMQSEGLLLA